MNEIELVRRFRAAASQPDPGSESTARAALLDAINQERSEGMPSRRRRVRLRTRVLAVALALAVLPAGYAIAQGVAGSSGEVRDESGNVVGISECPEATEAFERAGVPVPTAYADRCPSRSEIEERIPALRELRRDAERLGISWGTPRD